MEAMRPTEFGAAEATHEGMGTVMSHRAYGGRAREAIEAVRAEAARLEQLLSRFDPGSDIARINGAAGDGWTAIGGETFRVLRRAVECAEATGGLFDPTVAPLSNAWDFRRGRVPAEGEIERARALVNFRDLALNPNRTARLRRPGQEIDLGGIAKGYASDAFLNVFRRYGVAGALTNLGGNVSALGARPDGSPWRVGIRHPRADGLIGAVAADGDSVVTSGDYERCFFVAGHRYHHLIDPRTGRPASSGLISATVVAPGAMDADALSTAAFIAGPEEGLALVSKCSGAGAVLIDARMRAYVTRNLLTRFQRVSGLDVLVV